MEKPIDIRAHHILCIPRFYSGGYDKHFADNMKRVCQYIRKNPLTPIRLLIAELDVLCRECPHQYEDRCAQTHDIGLWVKSQDKKVAEYLGLEAGSIHTARDIFNLGLEKVGSDNIEQVCADCIYLDNCIKVGVNNSFRKELNKTIKK